MKYSCTTGQKQRQRTKRSLYSEENTELRYMEERDIQCEILQKHLLAKTNHAGQETTFEGMNS